jgi:hypothetical protein
MEGGGKIYWVAICKIETEKNAPIRANRFFDDRMDEVDASVRKCGLCTWKLAWLAPLASAPVPIALTFGLSTDCKAHHILTAMFAGGALFAGSCVLTWVWQ